jgi:hypothetical protein
MCSIICSALHWQVPSLGILALSVAFVFAGHDMEGIVTYDGAPSLRAQETCRTCPIKHRSF